MSFCSSVSVKSTTCQCSLAGGAPAAGPLPIDWSVNKRFQRVPDSAGPPREGGFHVCGFEDDLGVREAKLGEAGGRVGLIAAAIPRLLCRRSVVSQAVGFDHQAYFRPVEVNLE